VGGGRSSYEGEVDYILKKRGGGSVVSKAGERPAPLRKIVEKGRNCPSALGRGRKGDSRACKGCSCQKEKVAVKSPAVIGGGGGGKKELYVFDHEFVREKKSIKKKKSTETKSGRGGEGEKKVI